MKREVRRELLDELPAGDRRAIGSRRDLQKVNAWMGHAHIMVRALTSAFIDRSPRSIVELGAGDGTFLLRLAKSIAPRWKPLRVVLVDRQRLLSPRTKAELAALSWHVESLEMDVFEWLQRPHLEHSDVTLANYSCTISWRTICEGSRHAAHQTGFFLACEPRRVILACAAALLGFIGCNDVSRHDAKVSVRAGFAEKELSALWPVDEGWRLMERQAGLFKPLLCGAADRGERRPGDGGEGRPDNRRAGLVTPSTFDALIIGGGPGGATSALLLGSRLVGCIGGEGDFSSRKGLREFLSATNLPLLRHLGVAESFSNWPARTCARSGYFRAIMS